MSSSIRIPVWKFVLILLISSQIARANQQSMITGDCVYDPSTDQMTCTYVVFSGIPALSHLIFPIPANCVEQFTVSSSFFQFEVPQTYNDPFCGEIFGIKSDQELGEGQVATFAITYDGVGSFDVGVVFVALKGGPNCQMFSVPAVVECPFQPNCQFSLDFTEYNFLIRKPGIFAGLLATMTATSNLPINITFESFGDLNPVQSFVSGQIPAFYATAPAELANPPAQFLTPVDFNQQVVIIPGDEVEHRFSIWSKLMVGKEISACEYMDVAIIRVEIENLEDYIDPDL